jgi:DNA-binding PadR family transcriptional regulator
MREHHHHHRRAEHPWHGMFVNGCGQRGGIRHEASGRGRHGGGRHGRDGDDFDFGGPRGGRFGGRVFGHGDLKLVLLSLIEERPRHGYELIRTIEEMFDGTYAPSPGAVYPTLTMLEEMDYARIEQSEEGGRKRYAITDAGRAFLDENRVAVQAVLERMQEMAETMSRMRSPMSIRKAMRDLKHALMARREHWSTNEADRILAILKKAAKDVRGDA